MDKCTARVRVRDARGDDVKATIIKEKKRKKYMSTVYGDIPKPKSNLDLCTNLVGVPVLGRVMLNPLRSRSLLAPFSTTRLSIKKAPPWALTSSPFHSKSLMLIEGQKNVTKKKMKAFIGEFLGFECKEG